MEKKQWHIYFSVIFFLSLCPMGMGQGRNQSSDPVISSFTSGMEKKEGFINFYWDNKEGKIWMEIEQFDSELLYYPSLASGLGSNDIGLDRGKIFPSHVIEFHRSGNKVLMVEPNYNYRALSDNPMERQAVEESFAKSVHWGFDIAAEEEGKVLVDGTAFFLQDAVGAAAFISRTRQGDYKLDPSRCAIYLPRTKNFPKNTEIEATITLKGDQTGSYLRAVVPSTNAVTLKMHHSFVELPDDQFVPRAFDPRTGANQVSFYDFASPVDQPIVKRYIRRHRLIKKDPKAAVSEVEEPIVYYIDPGTPEPIRTALMEGAKWWGEAFEEAGFKNAFQVKLLPKDADPMDIRYHLVQWVHRSSRGWSYGGGITDPRTGEIIKGKVTLGSLRVRQDYLIAQGLLGHYEAGKPEDQALMNLAMARMRQLAAHEVGHTLGLSHNYIASTHGRSSVMDYPHPTVHLTDDNSIDVSDAYAEGIGEWDKVAINLAYSNFPPGSNELEEIDKLVKAYQQKGLGFLSDQDARPPGSAHPKTHLWDNGTDPVEELEKVMKIRKIVLDNFSENKIREGQPLATLEEVLVPMYLFHRYQVEATSKLIAGVNYGYTMRGEKGNFMQPVSADLQVIALNSLLSTLKPDALALPEKVLRIIPPRPYGYPANQRETFNRNTGLVFDPLSPPEIAARHTLTFLLNPERASRLIAQNAIDPDLPDLGFLIDKVMETTWKTAEKTGYHGEIKRVVEKMVLQHLIELSANQKASAQARAIALYKINELKEWLTSRPSSLSDGQKAHNYYCISMINDFEQTPGKAVEILSPLPAPDGAPIGQGSPNWLGPICDFNPFLFQ